MKLWVDDVRLPPDDDWVWCQTSEQAISVLDLWRQLGRGAVFPDVVSLDHDLGGDDTTRPVVLWMCENDYWPVKTVVHSSNPVGREWLEGMIERYSLKHD